MSAIAISSAFFRELVPKEGEQDHDRQRDAEHPKQKSTSHDVILLD
jgi:hypothetical protein